jgi:putative phosphoribosyl transferase
VRLAEALEAYRGQDPLVLAIPRGGVPVAAEVARRLGAELDVVITRKLGVPAEPELAMGALTADGGLYVNQETVTGHEVSAEQLAEVIARETEAAVARDRYFRGERPQPRIGNRAVIVIDDGLATGATMRATLRALRLHLPARLVAAVPVGSDDGCADLRNDADEVICLYEPDPFSSVGTHYGDFKAPDDEEVRRILHDFNPGDGLDVESAPPATNELEPPNP